MNMQYAAFSCLAGSAHLQQRSGRKAVYYITERENTSPALTGSY